MSPSMSWFGGPCVSGLPPTPLCPGLGAPVSWVYPLVSWFGPLPKTHTHTHTHPSPYPPRIPKSHMASELSQPFRVRQDLKTTSNSQEMDFWPSLEMSNEAFVMTDWPTRIQLVSAPLLHPEGCQGRQGSRGCIPGSPGESGLVSRGSQGLRSPLE